MGLPAVTLTGGTSGNAPLLSKRQAKLAANRLSKQINQSAVNSNLVVVGADTVFAGTSSLLISLGGMDTLGSSRDFIQFQVPQPGGYNRQTNPVQSTLPGGTNVSFAAAGNLTLMGAGYSVAAPPAPTDSVMGSAQSIATVFGAAIPGSVLTFNQAPIPVNQPPSAAVSVSGAAPDLLLGWSFDAPGYTVVLGAGSSFGGPPGPLGRNGTDVRFTGAPKQGAIEFIFPKQS